MLKLRFPWKQNKTKVKRTIMMAATKPAAMEEELLIQEQNLHPCNICGRTFLPNPLKKHQKVCEKFAVKKRKPFDSLKQRVAGTDLAHFHQKTYLKKKDDTTLILENNNKKPKLQNKWKEKHLEFVSAIRAAKGVPDDEESKHAASPSAAANLTPATTNNKSRSTTSITLSQNEQCPSCDRCFGPKAFDRHVEWCKERRVRIQQTPVNVQQAKERLEARIKYRVPPLFKSKRALIREKYSGPQSPEPIISSKSVNSTSNLCSISPSPLSRVSSIRKPKSLVNVVDKHFRVRNNKPSSSDRMTKSDMEKCDGDKKRNSPDLSLNFCAPIIMGTPSPKAESEKSNHSSSSLLYDPFELAQRQFMELLDCDEFKPLLRPHSTLPTPFKKIPAESSLSIKKKLVKSAEPLKSKREIAIIDNSNSDEFELIEDIIKENFDDDDDDADKIFLKNHNNNNFYLHDDDINRTNRKLFNNNDDMNNSSIIIIDPSLINETDNLSIPDHFQKNIDDSSGLEIDTNNENNSSSSKSSISKNKPSIKRSLSLVNRNNKRDSSSLNNNNNNNNKSSNNNNVKKVAINIQQQKKSSSDLNKKNDNKKKSLPHLLKRSMTVFDPPPKNSFKNKEEVDNYLNGANKEKKLQSISTNKEVSSISASVEDSSSLKAEDLFAVDDEMYEEYKKYEEMYLKEKEQQNSSSTTIKKSKTKTVDLNLALLPTTTENDSNNSNNNSNNNNNNKLSNDSAYGSLRKNSKHRSRTPQKLTHPKLEMENNLPTITTSSSSSGSSEENGLNSPLSSSSSFIAASSVTTKYTKFCHECGTKFPVSTAKFCVECGVKRLML